MHLQIGDEAPQFSLLSDENKWVSLKDFPGKNVLLYFYPKDDTPGCTKQACYFRDAIDQFEQQDTVIIGISKDSIDRHKKFKQKYNLPFMLLADTDGKVCEAYGVINSKSLFGKSFLGIQRSTFLIGADGKIKTLWRKVKVNEHLKQVLHELNQEQH